jgi:homoserine kinase type II
VSGNEKELETLVEYLLGVYDRGASGANALGLPSWPECIVHSDWHPGNLLFRKQRVVAVIDYDSARRARRMIDVANGALQFSIIAGGDPAGWPDELDEGRFHAFLEGYESHCPLGTEERRCIPFLMAEAIIAECVPPITETGSVGRWAGFRVLQMVRRKVRWMETHGERLIDDALVRQRA